MEDDLNTIPNCFSISILLKLKSGCMPKISLLSYLIMEIAVKKTLKLWFGRWLQNMLNFLLHFLFSYFKSKLPSKNQLPRCLGSGAEFCWPTIRPTDKATYKSSQPELKNAILQISHPNLVISNMKGQIVGSCSRTLL